MLQFPDEILENVIGLLRNARDRNAVSLLCKRFHAIEGTSRENVLVSNCYAIQPLKLASRFPNATSVTIKGKPRIVDFSLIPEAEVWGAYARPWVEVLARFFQHIRHVKLKRMTVSDSDIERLVSACGTSLQSLELEKCSGFSTRGLEMIARACRNLVVLNLSEADIRNEGSPFWLTTLSNTARSLEVLNLSLTEVEDVESHVLVDLASRCRDLRLSGAMKIDHVLAVVKAASSSMQHLGIRLYSQNVENPDLIAEAFQSCTGLQGLSALWDLDDGSMMMVMPVAARLTSLDLTYAQLLQPELTDLLASCINLEDLQCTDIVGDRGLREVGNHCSKLKRLIVQQDEQGFVTQHGLTAVAQGCCLLEKIIIYAADMTNKALESLADNCPNLSDIRICLVQKYDDSHPVIELEGSSTLNLGVKALLMKCRKARRLALCFSRFGLTNVVITDEGMSYIGRYGGNLDIITLTNCGSSDVGLACLAAGCVKLRKLELRHCPFGDLSMAALAYGVPRLKFLWVQACQVELAGVRMLAQRPEFVVEVVKESCTSSGVITPWQLIAYSSAAPPRTDLPDNIDHVHDKYCTPLYREYYLCPSTVENGTAEVAEPAAGHVATVG